MFHLTNNQPIPAGRDKGKVGVMEAEVTQGFSQ